MCFVIINSIDSVVEGVVEGVVDGGVDGVIYGVIDGGVDGMVVFLEFSVIIGRFTTTARHYYQFMD